MTYIPRATQPLVIYTTYASLPAAGVAGRMASVSDSPIAQWIDDGSTWRPLINGVIGVAPPLVASLTAFNQGGAVFTQLNGAILVTGVNDGAAPGATRGMAVANVAATAYAELASAFRAIGDTTTNHFNGAYAILRESATAKAYTLDVFQDFNSRRTTIQAEVWTNNTTRPTNVDKGYANWDATAPLFVRVRRDATNLFGELSRDRQTWVTVDTRSIASVFTTAPDTAGFGVLGVNVVPVFNVVHFVSGS